MNVKYLKNKIRDQRKMKSGGGEYFLIKTMSYFNLKCLVVGREWSPSVESRNFSFLLVFVLFCLVYF